MADVFISYKRTDLDRITPIIEALSAAGLSVWYDASLQAGSSFDAEITKELRAAKAVLVCWSRESVESEWVRAEATEGRQRNALVSCLLEPCSPFPPFNLIHHEDLSDWRGAPNHIGWRRLISAIGARTGRRDLQALAPAGPVPAPGGAVRRGGPKRALMLAAAAVVLIGAGAGAFVWVQNQSAPSTPDPAAELSSTATVAVDSEPAPAPVDTGATVVAPAPEAEAEPAKEAAADRPGLKLEAVPRPVRAGFTMVKDGEPTFGRAKQAPYNFRFPQGQARASILEQRFIPGLVSRFADERLEGVDIIAPQIRDEAAAELRDRRIYALTQAFTKRGVPAKDIAISYEAREADDLDRFRIIVYHRPVETEAAAE